MVRDGFDHGNIAMIVYQGAVVMGAALLRQLVRLELL